MFRLYAAFNQSTQFSVIIYNQNFIHGSAPSLVLSGHQSASLQFWGSAKHRPFSQRRGYAHPHNNKFTLRGVTPHCSAASFSVI